MKWHLVLKYRNLREILLYEKELIEAREFNFTIFVQ